MRYGGFCLLNQIDKSLYILLRLTCGLIKIWPPACQKKILGFTLNLAAKGFSRFNRVSRQNLRLAFPKNNETWYDQTIADSHQSLAQLFIDLLRLEKLDQDWITRHVQHSALLEIDKFPPISTGQGVIFASGHLGSFELLGHALAKLRKPLCFVAREFRNPPLNIWWQHQRQLSGNETISNRGAYKGILKRIQSGHDVAIPIDQNVKRDQAVFVDWFGHKAATSGAPARAALRTGAALVVVSIANEGTDQYRIKVQPCDYADVYSDSSLDRTEKVVEITQRISNSFCQMIAEQPEQWFWLHRRWKTAPTGDTREALYSKDNI